jgi:hypothetical protein
MKIPTYPARPVNGGPLDRALPKSSPHSFDAKYNGWRALVHIPTCGMFNRKGEPLSIASEFQPALNQLRVTLDCEAFKWADCEALERRHGIGRGTLILLDVLPEPQYRAATRDERILWIPPAVVPYHQIQTKPAPDSLYQTEKFSAGEADAAWQNLQAINLAFGCEFYEGLVAKRADSKYPFQLRSPEETFPFWIKHRWAF